MKIEVVMAWPHQSKVVAVELPFGATVADAVEAAGLTGTEGVVGYAVFGINTAGSTVLAQGDRVELLRPLQLDPMTARRRRAARPKP